jgi:hypothetical protein
MAQLKLNGRIVFSLVVIFSSLASASITYRGAVAWPSDMKFKKTKVGGISGLVQDGENLWAVSDDRGQWGAPRLYQLSLGQNAKSEFTLKIDNVIFLKRFISVHGAWWRSRD